MKTQFVSAAIALSVVAGTLAVPATASAMTIRTKPVETVQKAENVHYYGYYYGYYPKYYYKKRHYGYYGYGY